MAKANTPDTSEAITGDLVPDGTVSIDLLGRTWRVVADSRKWDFEALEALEFGRAVTFLRHVLGTRQMALFATGGHRTVGDARALMDAIMRAVAEAETGE